MSETTSTTTAQALRRIADALDSGRLPKAAPQINFYQCDDDELRLIMAEFADLTWSPVRSGDTEWINARAGSVTLTAFAASPEPVDTTPRLAALFIDEQVSA